MEFSTNMLKWEPGPRKEDGIWAKYWYKNVHKSTGFQKKPTPDEELSPEMENLLKEARYFYQIMNQHAIKI